MHLRCRFVTAAWLSLALVAALGPLASCQRASANGRANDGRGGSANGEVVLDERGTDGRGIPRYTHRALSPGERSLLRVAFGVDEPEGLYLSDSTDDALVKFDTRAKRCQTCYVDSYRVGFLSLRLPNETWEGFEQRMHAKKIETFSIG